MPLLRRSLFFCVCSILPPPLQPFHKIRPKIVFPLKSRNAMAIFTPLPPPLPYSTGVIPASCVPPPTPTKKAPAKIVLPSARSAPTPVKTGLAATRAQGTSTETQSAEVGSGVTGAGAAGGGESLALLPLTKENLERIRLQLEENLLQDDGKESGAASLSSASSAFCPYNLGFTFMLILLFFPIYIYICMHAYILALTLSLSYHLLFLYSLPLFHQLLRLLARHGPQHVVQQPRFAHLLLHAQAPRPPVTERLRLDLPPSRRNTFRDPMGARGGEKEGKKDLFNT